MNSNDWIIIAIPIATLIVSIVNPFLQVWLQNRSMNRAVANPDKNQPKARIARAIAGLTPVRVGIFMAAINLFAVLRVLIPALSREHLVSPLIVYLSLYVASGLFSVVYLAIYIPLNRRLNSAATSIEMLAAMMSESEKRSAAIDNAIVEELAKVRTQVHKRKKPTIID